MPSPKITLEDEQQFALRLKDAYHIKTIEATKIDQEEIWVWRGGYYQKNGDATIHTEVLNSELIKNETDEDGELVYCKKINLGGENEKEVICDKDESGSYIKSLTLLYNMRNFNSILNFIKAQTRNPRDAVYQIPNTINLLNGVLIIKTIGKKTEVEFLPRDKEQPSDNKGEEEGRFWDYNFQYILPVKYDSKLSCPEISLLMNKILIDKSATAETILKEQTFDEWEESMQDAWKDYQEEQERFADAQAEQYRKIFPQPGDELITAPKLKEERIDDETFEKIQKIYIFEEYIGSLLMSKYEIKKAVVFVGDNDTGKTTLLNAVRQFIGDKNVASVTLSDLDKRNSRFASSGLEGKLANIVDEMPAIDTKSYDVFKGATGGAAFSAEKKGKDSYQMENTAKMLFTANELPTIPEKLMSSVMNRMVIVEFNNRFPAMASDTNRSLKDKQYSEYEMSGLLNLAITGLKRLLRQGRYSYNDETTPTLWNKWSYRISPTQEFLTSETEVTKRKEDYIMKRVLVLMYQKYCADNKTNPLSEIIFGREISNTTGVTSKRIYNQFKSSEKGYKVYDECWVGIRPRLKIEAPEIPSATIFD